MQKTLSPLLGACRNAAIAALLLVVISVYSVAMVSPKNATAAASNTINFQARLMTASGAIVPDGNYNVEFKLYNALTSSGSAQGSCTGDSACLWTETRTSANQVRVANGYLTVELGSVTALPTSIDWSQNLYLTMNIGGTGTPSWDGEMSPRLHLTAVPHAFTADKLTNTNGSFTSTLGFTTPTASRSILLPDEAGTLCIQNSTNCGFASSTGSTNYIQNQNASDQTANFRISGTGRAATALQAPLFDTATAVALGIGTTNATAINLNKSTTITGGITQSGGAISLTGNAASSITTSTGGLTLTAAATSSWTVGGTNQSLTVTTSGTGTLTLGTTGAGTVTIGTSSATINVGTTNVAHTVHIADGGTSTTQTVTIGSTNGSSKVTIQGGTSTTALALTTGTNGKLTMSAQGTGGIAATVGSTGFNINTTTNSDYALSVQDSGSLYAFSVSTNTGMVTLGALQATYSGFDETLNTPFGNLTVGSTSNALTLKGSSSMTIQATSGSFTTTVGFTAPTANRTITMPDESGTVCLRTSSACGFVTGTAANYIQNTTTVQSANVYVQAATSGSVAAVLQANAAGAGDVLDLKNGAGTNVATFGSTGSVLFKNSANSVTAFEVQNASGASVLTVDTTNKRIGISNNTPTVDLDVGPGTLTAGQIVQIRVGDFLLQSQQGGANGIAALTSRGSNGNLTVDGASGSAVYLAPFTTNNVYLASGGGKVAIGNITPAVALDVSGAMQQTGLMTSDTQGTDAGKWTQLGTCTITAQYQQCLATVSVIGGHDGTAADNTFASFHVRVKQQNALGGAPYVNVALDPSMSIIDKDAISAVTTTNNGTTTVVQLWGKITNSYEHWFFTPLMNSGNGANATWTWLQSAGFSAALPTGTVTNSAYSTNYADTLTVRNATNSTTAFRVQNAAGTSLLNVDATSNGLITASTGLKLNVTSTNATSFTTPLGASVPTAINIPLYNPGAFGQLLAFGLPSTADTTARAISVFDARSSGTIQPAIALFSPNENDVFGLSWNGLNTTASIETASAAIALRPGGTNVKLWAGSTGVAIGSNVSSAAYPLDVTGDINSSTALRIAGTSVCDTTGSTGCIAKSGSGYYIHNQTTVQSANMYIQSAASGTATAVLQANATSGNILNLVSGGGTTIGTVNNSGAASFQNSSNSTAAFQISAVNTNSVFRVDTTNERVAIGVISDPIGAKLSVATSSTVALRAYQGGSSDSFQLGNATADFLTVSSTGNFLLKPTTDSNQAMRVQNAGGTTMFTVDTAGTDVLIGSATTDANAVLLALDSYNGSSDPTGIAGAMYYSTTYNAMRCYQDGSWSNCSDPTRLSHGYNIQEDFFGSDDSNQATYCNGTTSIAINYSWSCWTGGTATTGHADMVSSDAAKRPGQVMLATGANAAGNESLYLGGGSYDKLFIGGGESFETAINIPTLSNGTQTYTIRIGLCDNNTHGADCTDGAYFEYSSATSANWRYATASGATRTKNSSTKAVATGWTNLKFVANSSSSITFYAKSAGETSYTSLGTITTNIPSSTANEASIMMLIDKSVGTTERSFTVDYVDYWNDLTSVR